MKFKEWKDTTTPNTFPTTSSYVERFWLPTLGPTATFLLRELHRLLEHEPSGITIAPEDLAATVGLGKKVSKNSALARALDRLCRFNAAIVDPSGVIWIKTQLPPLSPRQVGTLPAHLKKEHRWVGAIA